MDIGERLENYRVERDWTYEHLGRVLGCTSKSAWNWCKGKTTPNARNAAKIRKAIPLDEVTV